MNLKIQDGTLFRFPKMESLREEDKIFIQNGVEIYGKEELNQIIEDFE